MWVSVAALAVVHVLHQGGDAEGLAQHYEVGVVTVCT